MLLRQIACLSVQKIILIVPLHFIMRMAPISEHMYKTEAFIFVKAILTEQRSERHFQYHQPEFQRLIRQILHRMGFRWAAVHRQIST